MQFVAAIDVPRSCDKPTASCLDGGGQRAPKASTKLFRGSELYMACSNLHARFIAA